MERQEDAETRNAPRNDMVASTEQTETRASGAALMGPPFRVEDMQRHCLPYARHTQAKPRWAGHRREKIPRPNRYRLPER